MYWERWLILFNLELWGWPHHHACSLWNGPLETSYHLSNCPLDAVWSLVTSWEHFAILDVAQHANFNTLDSWEHSLRSIPKDHKRAFNGLAIYTMWNLRKEWNHRIFESTQATALQVAGMNKKKHGNIQKGTLYAKWIGLGLVCYCWGSLAGLDMLVWLSSPVYKILS